MLCDARKDMLGELVSVYHRKLTYTSLMKIVERGMQP